MRNVWLFCMLLPCVAFGNGNNMNSGMMMTMTFLAEPDTNQPSTLMFSHDARADNSPTYTDYSDYGNDMYQTNSSAQPVYTNESGNYALYFDGVDDRILHTTDVDRVDIEGDFTISTWAKDQTSGAADNYLVTKYSNDAWYWAFYFNTQDRLTLVAWTNNYQEVYVRDADASFADAGAAWHHYVCVLDRDQSPLLYVDGIVQSSYASQVDNGGSATNAGTCRVSNHKTVYMKVTQDDTRIYNRAFASNEVHTLFTDGRQ